RRRSASVVKSLRPARGITGKIPGNVASVPQEPVVSCYRSAFALIIVPRLGNRAGGWPVKAAIPPEPTLAEVIHATNAPVSADGSDPAVFGACCERARARFSGRARQGGLCRGLRRLPRDRPGARGLHAR